jgi:hypothetical protein
MRGMKTGECWRLDVFTSLMGRRANLSIFFRGPLSGEPGFIPLCGDMDRPFIDGLPLSPLFLVAPAMAAKFTAVFILKTDEEKKEQQTQQNPVEIPSKSNIIMKGRSDNYHWFLNRLYLRRDHTLAMVRRPD